MSEKDIYLTGSSLEKLKKEFEELKLNKIPDIANRIHEAKQQGDLSENAEYHQAKEDMAWAQGRLMELNHILDRAKVIEDATKGGEAQVGNKVRVKINEKEKEYTIVGPQEASPANGLISNESPLGSAFLGRSKGEKVMVQTPAGNQEYEILEIV